MASRRIHYGSHNDMSVYRAQVAALSLITTANNDNGVKKKPSASVRRAHRILKICGG